jgi:hypothetical protein
MRTSRRTHTPAACLPAHVFIHQQHHAQVVRMLLVLVVVLVLLAGGLCMHAHTPRWGGARPSLLTARGALVGGPC